MEKLKGATIESEISVNNVLCVMLWSCIITVRSLRWRRGSVSSDMDPSESELAMALNGRARIRESVVSAGGHLYAQVTEVFYSQAISSRRYDFPLTNVSNRVTHGEVIEKIAGVARGGHCPTPCESMLRVRPNWYGTSPERASYLCFPHK